MAALAALALALVALWLSPATEPDLNLVVWAAMAIYLELIAVPQRGFGFFSCSFACLFAMMLDPALGARWSVGLAVLGLLVRTGFKGDANPAVRWREALADLLPILAALAAGAALPTPLAKTAAGLALYLPLSLSLPGWLAEESPGVQLQLWRYVREMSGYHCVAVGFSGPILFFLAEKGALNSLWILPLFFALHRAARTDLLRLEELEKEILQERERLSQRALAETSERLELTSRQLQAEVQGRGFLEQLTRRLWVCQQAQEVLAVMLQSVAEAMPFRSLVFFLPGSQGLVPALWRSPCHERLETASLHCIREPLAEAAWARSQMVAWQPHVDQASASVRILQGEGIAVAIPLETQGVMCVGRSEPTPFTAKELDELSSVAAQGALALQSVGLRQETREALTLYQQAHQKLSQAVNRLSFLLEGARALSAPLDVDALFDRFRQIVESLLPGHCGVLIYNDQVHLLWPEDSAPQDQEPLMALHATVRVAARPLILEQFTRSRFVPPAPHLQSMLAVPLVDEEGSWGSVLVFSSEIASFHREDQEILELVASQLVTALRRADLTSKVSKSQAQLALASKMAALGQLAAGLAHELNTPLAAAVLQMESSLRCLPGRPNAIPEKLGEAIKAINRVKTILAKLLYYSRDDWSADRRVDLNAVVEDTLVFMEGQIKIKGVQVETELRPLPPVSGNPTELQQVLTNLLLNARDAVLTGSSSLLVRVETGVHDGQVFLQVVDYGPGIAAEVRPRIFEPFFTTRPVGQGMGLGLSVSLEIVEGHGGELVLVQHEAKTIFRMLLPAAQGP